MSAQNEQVERRERLRKLALETVDLAAALTVGLALQLGPDFLLAPAGLVSDEGIRPGFALEEVVGSLIDADAQWLVDRREKLAAQAA